jgi:hypothetical protein
MKTSSHHETDNRFVVQRQYFSLPDVCKSVPILVDLPIGELANYTTDVMAEDGNRK